MIFVTAKTEVEDETRGFSLGAVDYISKPFNPSIVKSRVQTHLALRKMREDLVAKNIILEQQMQEIQEKIEIEQLKANREERKIQKTHRKKLAKEQAKWIPEPGDMVKIGNGRQTGTVIVLDLHKGKGVVHFGMMKTIVDIDRMVVVKKGDGI